MSRSVTDFFVTRLVLGSTDRREVIRDFFSSHGLSRNNLFYHELSNYRISFTRNVKEVTDFLCPEFFPCPEFSNYRIVSSHGMSRSVTDFFVPRLVLGPTDQQEVIAEFLSITRSVADGCGACSSCEWGLFVVVYRPIRGVCV